MRDLNELIQTANSLKARMEEIKKQLGFMADDLRQVEGEMASQQWIISQ